MRRLEGEAGPSSKRMRVVRGQKSEVRVWKSVG